jgi:polysaccharide biosynthesis transport protein
MKEPSEVTKALQVLFRESAVRAYEEKSGYATPPIVAYGDEAGPEGELHLRDYWRTIWKRAWLIIGLVAIVGSLAAIHQARQPDIYQARAQVQVDSENVSPAFGASKGGSVYVESNTYVDPEYFNTQMQILTSPTLLRRVVRDLDLERNQKFLNPRVNNQGIGTSLLRMFGLKRKDSESTASVSTTNATGEDNLVSHSTTSSLNLDDPATVDRLAPLVGSLQNMLQVSQIKRTRLIEIRASHPDPAIATKVVNATADAFTLWNLDVKTKTNTIAGTYLQKRIAELQAQIRTGEEQLANYAQNHEILSLDANQNTVVERLAGLNKQLLEAENERNLAEAAYKAGAAPGAAEASVEISDKQVAELKGKLAELRQKRAQLLVTDTEESPEVKDTTEQIAQVEKQLAETRSSAKNVYLVNLQTNYRKAMEREIALRDAFQKQRAETVTQNQSAINYNILKQEIETNKGLLEGLMQRAKENDVTMAGTPNNIHVVDYAPVPKAPIGPRRLQSVMIAVVLALAFGIALALFLEYLDDTVKTTNDVERGLRLPALAVIPIASKSTAKRLLPLAGLQKSNGNGNGHRNGSGRELLLNDDGPSLQGEAYRHLRTSVLLSTPGRPPKTLLVTSSVPSEGKTTTVVNTATVMAQTGAKVLVIDADMRRPRLHQLFSMENTRGLSSILSSNCSETEILSVITQYQDSNIYLLSSGAIPPNPAELLGSEQFRRLLEVVNNTFNHVIIDSPPIASFTDGVLISSNVDGVLLVVHGGKTSRQVVRRTRQLLQEIGAKIIGVVLNKIDVRSQNYYYHHDYKDYYAPPQTASETESLSIVGK